MNTRRVLRVKEVALLAGVTVRALHHYDELGLLVPSQRSRSGYRLYTEQDLLRLQQILIGRELGLPLEEIRRSLDDPRFDLKKTLLSQRELLQQRARKTAEMLRSIDQALALIDRARPGETMNHKEMFEGFDPSEHQEEARQRWGSTEAYQASARRAKTYRKEDWAAIQAEQKAIYDDAAAAMRAGKRPEDEAVLAIAERHRLSIDRWFYPCGASMHENLADLYEADPRFAASIDRHGEGLTPFLSAAIRANARRLTEPGDALPGRPERARAPESARRLTGRGGRAATLDDGVKCPLTAAFLSRCRACRGTERAARRCGLQRAWTSVEPRRPGIPGWALVLTQEPRP